MFFPKIKNPEENKATSTLANSLLKIIQGHFRVIEQSPIQLQG